MRFGMAYPKTDHTIFDIGTTQAIFMQFFDK